jgi:hypothetical protein
MTNGIDKKEKKRRESVWKRSPIPNGTARKWDQ